MFRRKALDQIFPENTRFATGNLLVVEEPSAEKRSHPCATPKRLTGGIVCTYQIIPPVPWP